MVLDYKRRAPLEHFLQREAKIIFCAKPWSALFKLNESSDSNQAYETFAVRLKSLLCVREVTTEDYQKVSVR